MLCLYNFVVLILLFMSVVFCNVLFSIMFLYFCNAVVF